jgi:phosphatidate cytidylyltransferase
VKQQVDPGDSAAGAEQAPADKTSRAGRNLSAAVAVGLALGALIVVPLYTQRVLFIPVVAAAVSVGLWELSRALRTVGITVPVAPVVAGGVAMLVLAYVRGAEAAVVALFLSVLATLLWRMLEGGPGLIKDVAASIMALLYIPFLASFAALLTAPEDGHRRVTLFIATAVCSDVGGYAAGVLAGRHPLAPSVSPKKSWEGLGGSVLACAVCGAILMATLLHEDWWKGAVFGLAVCLAATLGDLGESMIKRDLGIKDMGSLLPGHGGIMDRLDSVLVVAPVAWLLISAFAPVPT